MQGTHKVICKLYRHKLAYGCIFRYYSQIYPEAQRGFLGGEIPLVKVDSLCAVDIHERETLG